MQRSQRKIPLRALFSAISFALIAVPIAANARTRCQYVGIVRTPALATAEMTRRATLQEQRDLQYMRTHFRVVPSSLRGFVDPAFCGLAHTVVNCLYAPGAAATRSLRKLAAHPVTARAGYPAIGRVSNNDGPFSFQANFWDYDEVLASIHCARFSCGQQFVALRSAVENNVFAYHGAPRDEQSCRAQANGLSIGEPVGEYYSQHTQNTMYVARINVIQAASNFVVINPSSFATKVQAVGWVYKDQGGHYWLQANSALAPTLSARANALFTAFGIALADTPSPHYAGASAPKLPKAESYASCWPDLPNEGKFG